MQKAVAIIPARFDSTRFPGKPLAALKGKPIIQHVYAQASAASEIESVYVATDDRRIFDAVEGFGGRAVMTFSSHTCGTDRIAEVAGGLECDIVINVQGDEPFIRPEMIDETVRILRDDPSASMSTLAVAITRDEDLVSPDVVKVVRDINGFALYFSRSPIPYYRDLWPGLDGIRMDDGINVLKHIGIYGFRKDVLLQFVGMRRSILEDIEKLEQLRALSSGIKIKVGETEHDTFGIDTEEDLRKAEQWQNISL